LFDALFNIIPLATEMDKVVATPTRAVASAVMPWDDAALARLDAAVEQEPYLIRISAAKRLRERAEADAREALEERVSLARLSAVLAATKREFA